MKIKIEENKSLIFYLKRERNLLHSKRTSGGDSATRNIPSDSSDPEIKESSKNENKYIYTYSKPRTKILFYEILTQVPHWKGAVIIYGDNGEKIKPIDCTYSTNNLRETFSKSPKTLNGKKVDRFTWMEGLLNSGEYKKLKIFIANSF